MDRGDGTGGTRQGCGRGCLVGSRRCDESQVETRYVWGVGGKEGGRGEEKPGGGGDKHMGKYNV